MESTKLSRRFGEMVRRRREAANLSQEGLADACGLHRTYVSLLERGLREPKLSTLKALAEGLDIPISVLVRELD